MKCMDLSPCDSATMYFYDYNETIYFPPLFPLFRSLRFLPMREPRGLTGLTLGFATSPAGSDLVLVICLLVVFRFLTGGSSNFLISFTTSSFGRLRCDVLESACCV